MECQGGKKSCKEVRSQHNWAELHSQPLEGVATILPETTRGIAATDRWASYSSPVTETTGCLSGGDQRETMTGFGLWLGGWEGEFRKQGSLHDYCRNAEKIP